MTHLRRAPAAHHKPRDTAGTYNQRGIDDIKAYLDAALADAGAGGTDKNEKTGSDYERGVTTPFRLQADRLSEALDDHVQGPRGGAAPLAR